MFDATIIFFFKNCVCVSLLLWFVSFLGNFFFSSLDNNNRQDFYECGFKTTIDIGFSLNFSFFISAIFLIIYDIELIILVPFLFNWEIISWESIFSYFFFLFVIWLTFVLDSWLNAIEWNF